MRHLELFAGVGGFRSAMAHLQEDGVMRFDNVGFSEINENAILTYKSNYDTEGEIEMGDIVSFTADAKNIEALPDFDILTGGFPCQSFSVMGKQKGFEDERGTMFFRIMDLVRVKRPKYLLLENVRNLFNHEKGATYRRILSELRGAGYIVYGDVFNTSDFGLPQTRNRAFIFATRMPVKSGFQYSSALVKRHFDSLTESVSVAIKSSVLDVLRKEVDKKYFLSHRMKLTVLSEGTKGFRGDPTINKRIAKPLTATMHKMHRAAQDNYYTQEFIDTNGEVDSSLTLCKEELAELPLRRLTPDEAFELQGFPPPDFCDAPRKLKAKDKGLYMQAGNAVSVNVAYAVLRYLIDNEILIDNN